MTLPPNDALIRPHRRKPELLAPAGDAQAMHAAVASGADAVYFGLDDGFNARARARNFALDQLGDTCDALHRAGVRAYLTLNTLIFESELQPVADVIRKAAQAGIDALIVQDPAVALLARAIAPTLHVHASTQMTVSSAEAAVFAERLGITRIVVPRELSVDEIAKMAQGTRLELEVFVHGALCMSWSGQCLTSEAWGGRSANRGQCAQACRMPYDLVVDGKTRDLGEVQYLLSPKDLFAAPLLERLLPAGVHGLKIEGRQKGPQYVATAVGTWRRWLDAKAMGWQDRASAERLEKDAVDSALSYSRGFSPGFLLGAQHTSLVEGRFPKHRGLWIGTVVAVEPRAVRVQRADGRPSTSGVGANLGHRVPDADEPSFEPPLPELRPGQGVGFDAGHPEDEHEAGGPIFRVNPTKDGWLLGFGTPGPDLTKIQPGHRVWLTSDPTPGLATARLLQAGLPTGRIDVVLHVSGREGEPVEIEARAQGPAGRAQRASVRGTTPLAVSQGLGMTYELLYDKLGSLGGTPFKLRDLVAEQVGPGLHVPVSELKLLRRELMTKLEAQVLAAARHGTDEADPAERLRAELTAAVRPVTWQVAQTPQVVALCRNEAQLEAVIAAGLPEVELDWMELVGLGKAVRRAREAGLKVTIATVRVQKPGEQGYDARIAQLQPDAVLVRHWGGLVQFAGLAGEPLAGLRPLVHGDFSLNVTNSLTANLLLGMGVDTLTPAHDLDEAQLQGLLAHVPAERLTVTIHHHIATFHTEHCVYAHLLSHGNDWRTCGRPCEAHEVSLRDHKGDEHPVVVDVGCRNTVFNAAAQSAASAVPRLVKQGVRRFRVEFLRETQTEAATVLQAYVDLLQGRIQAGELVRRVGVHEQFGVTLGTMKTMSGARLPEGVQP